ncbi:MAG: homoserine kinase [Coriobacteriales bacterium]
MSARVVVPASSANLGSGYDAFGLAVALYDRFEAERSPVWEVEVKGEGEGELLEDERNQVVRAMQRAFAETGYRGAARVRCENGIPVGRGLGSSSAAIVGGLVLANELLGGPLGLTRLFQLAVELEGHPDNVAAALLGGFTVCWYEGAVPRAERIEPGGGLAAVAVVSEAAVATAEARRVLPASVPHADAAFGAGRAGLLAAGIALGRADLIRAGGADKIHEAYRERLYPDVPRVKAALMDAGADAAVLSGAGPTVIGLVSADDEQAALDRAHRVQAAFEANSDAPGRVAIPVPVDRCGVRVE